MTAEKVYRVHCDRPGCGQSLWAPSSAWNSDRARAAAKEKGWHLSDGMDLCFNCWTLGHRHSKARTPSWYQAGAR